MTRGLTTFTRPCCGATGTLDRSLGSAWLPHARVCRWRQNPNRVRIVRVTAGHLAVTA